MKYLSDLADEYFFAALASSVEDLAILEDLESILCGFVVVVVATDVASVVVVAVVVVSAMVVVAIIVVVVVSMGVVEVVVVVTVEVVVVVTRAEQKAVDAGSISSCNIEREMSGSKCECCVYDF